MSKYNPCPDQAGARISWSGHLVIVVLESVVVVSFCNAPYKGLTINILLILDLKIFVSRLLKFIGTLLNNLTAVTSK